jgi:hypothetical protein
MSTSSAAQVNVERLRTDLAKRPLFASIAASVAGRAGNVNSIVSGGSVFAGGLTGRNLLFVRAEGAYEAYGGEAKVAKSFAHARYNYEVLPWLFAEVFTQVQQDNFERLRLRTLYGTGPRFALLRSDDVEVYYGLSYMLEFERINVAPGAPDAASTWAQRFNNYLAIGVRIDERVRFTSATYFQPRFDDWSDHRLLSESAFAVALGKRLFNKLSLVVRYDSAPPTTVHPVDVEVQNGFGASF